ncbi:hypothetical protein HYG86_14620 [Alkalicella caledoniensis]|uniref:Uncharacterized protein n=1 Tax=Alkalicella caledoniensis TaxID=2731377 RepID=A0A7G9WB51_ALKCA|nr:hypothetical protein [Alkalicella caledoniensis]QNO15913.1 hypothetical protein HYG86_14620 [Alkalicella caledoniensis]
MTITSTEDYIITLNENNYSLNNICHEKINNIPDGSGESLAQIEIKEKFILAINPIQITIREKGTNRIHIEDNIFILQSLRYEFDKKYYYKEDEAILTGLYADDINLAEKVNDSTKINLRKNKSYKTQILHKNNRYWLTIEIPILYWKFDNVKSDMKTSRYIWHEDVETYNLFINYPSDIKPPGLHVITESSIEVIQGKFTREGYKYSLEYLFKVTNQGPISLGVIIDGNQEAITEIHFNPVIKNLSVAYYDNNSLINGLVASWSFLGSGELSADIVYSETSKVIKNYKLKKGQQILDKKIELFYGEHEIKLYQVQEDDFFVGSEVRTDLAQQEFIVGDPIIVKTKSKILKCKKCLCEDIEYDVQNFYLKDLRFSSKWGHYVATGYYLKRDKYTGQERIWYFTKHNPFELRLLNQEDNQYIFEIVDKDQDGLIYDKQTTNINPVYEDGDVSRFKLIDEVVLEIIE